MKQLICNLADVPAEGEARVFPFFGREVQVWRTGDHVRAAANTCLLSVDRLNAKMAHLSALGMGPGSIWPAVGASTARHQRTHFS